MAAYSFNNNDFSSGNCYSGFLDHLGSCSGSSHGGTFSVPVPVSQSLVLDSEKGELVKAPSKLGKKSASEEKVIAALKSHSEAERRRRERINAHLDTLRTLLPCREKVSLLFICYQYCYMINIFSVHLKFSSNFWKLPFKLVIGKFCWENDLAWFCYIAWLKGFLWIVYCQGRVCLIAWKKKTN